MVNNSFDISTNQDDGSLDTMNTKKRLMINKSEITEDSSRQEDYSFGGKQNTEGNPNVEEGN